LIEAPTTAIDRGKYILLMIWDLPRSDWIPAVLASAKYPQMKMPRRSRSR